LCKVDAACGPIEVSDMLTTSSTPGHAMRPADPARVRRRHRQGAQQRGVRPRADSGPRHLALGNLMSTLRTAIRKIQRFSSGQSLNVGEVAEFLGVHRPVSVRELVRRTARLPDAVPFHADVVTGAALGGHLDLTLRSDGGYHFSGRMRATGLPSFSFTVVAIVRSASGQVTVAAQHSGEVFGSDTPGSREDRWSEEGTDPQQFKLIRNTWPDLSGGTITERHGSDVIGTLGTGLDVLGDLAEFFVVAETLGVGLAVCLVVGDELNKAGATLPGLGGVVGIAVAAGVVYIFGPSSIIAAVAAGVVAGEVVDAMVQLRELTGPEVAFARTVFGDSLDFSRIRLTNLLGLQSRAFTAPTVGHISLVNIGDAINNPTTATSGAYPKPGQLFIHELTHAWQIQHASLQDGFVPGLMCQGILNQTVVSNPYHYGAPGPPWRSFGMESQAAIVDQWFGGTGKQRTNGGMMDKSSPYFGYIASNVLPGVP
jgi:hypothetical protein